MPTRVPHTLIRMAHHVPDERQEFAATLRAAGPQAPTLCGDWRTSELLAHLILRERLSAEAAGRVPVRRLRELSEHVIAGYVADHDYPEMVDTFEAGPPAISPWAIPAVREAFNLLEYTVHHEDVRRARRRRHRRARCPTASRAGDLEPAAPLGPVHHAHGPDPGPAGVAGPRQRRRRAHRGHGTVRSLGAPMGARARRVRAADGGPQVSYHGSPEDVATVRRRAIAV